MGLNRLIMSWLVTLTLFLISCFLLRRDLPLGQILLAFLIVVARPRQVYAMLGD